MSVVPTVTLADLQLPPSGIAGPTYATTVEALAVALSRHSAVVLRFPGKAQGAALKAGLTAMLAGGTRSQPGCELREWRVGGAQDAAAIEEAYGTLESAARLVLSALCRSSLLRLRADAFSGVLDDLPLSRSVQGSSVLTARRFLDNFSHLPAEEGSAVLPLFADPQDAVSERGLLSLFYSQEAREGPAGSTLLSAMQVQDSSGRWQDVQLGANDVAVLLGHSMEHATAGLLRTSVHRVVGAPYATASASDRRRRSVGHTAGRTSLHFELRPRPAAVLDLRPQLEAAGHAVSARFSPMSVSSLLERFESLLSPAAKVATPDQQQGAAAHAAWEEAQATLKKGRKRASGMGAGILAAARGATSLRSTEGQLNQQQRPSSRFKQQQQQPQGAGSSAAAAAAEEKENDEGMEWDDGAQQRRHSGAAEPGRWLPLRPGSAGTAGGGQWSLGSAGGGGGEGRARERRASLEPASSAPLIIVRGRTCAVLDGCVADDPAQCLTVCVRSFTGVERWFYVNAATRCGAIFEVFCARLGISLGAVKFLLRGERVFGASTPASLKMLDGDELTAVPESTDRLQQQRELGPLFAAVFGSAAAAAGQGKEPELL